MKIGVIGGNASVAAEICFILNSRGHTVVPIVRRMLDDAFFAYYGFDYRVGNVTNQDNVESLLHGFDAVLY
jgi:putative NADH-flavin reductase